MKGKEEARQRKKEKERKKEGDSKEEFLLGVDRGPGSVCGYLLDVGYPSAASLLFDAVSVGGIASISTAECNRTRGLETTWPAGGSP